LKNLRSNIRNGFKPGHGGFLRGRWIKKMTRLVEENEGKNRPRVNLELRHKQANKEGSKSINSGCPEVGG